MKNKKELLIHVVLGVMFGLVLIHISKMANAENQVQATAAFVQVQTKKHIEETCPNNYKWNCKEAIRPSQCFRECVRVKK